MSTTDDILVVAVKRGTEWYMVLYREETRSEAMRTVGRWAGDPGLSLTWLDAATMSQKMRGMTEDAEKWDGNQQ